MLLYQRREHRENFDKKLIKRTRRRCGLPKDQKLGLQARSQTWFRNSLKVDGIIQLRSQTFLVIIITDN